MMILLLFLFKRILLPVIFIVQIANLVSGFQTFNNNNNNNNNNNIKVTTFSHIKNDLHQKIRCSSKSYHELLNTGQCHHFHQHHNNRGSFVLTKMLPGCCCTDGIATTRRSCPFFQPSSIDSTRYNDFDTILKRKLRRNKGRIVVSHSRTTLQSHHPAFFPPSSLLSSTTSLFGSKSSFLGFMYMALLAFQFAIQPILIKKFAPKDKMIGTTYVFTESIVLGIITISFISFISPNLASIPLLQQQQQQAAVTVSSLLSNNNINENLFQLLSYYKQYILVSLQVAGIPAFLDILQKYCKLYGYQVLQPITFNAINQTKTLFAAIFCFLLLRQKQSVLQLLSLLILLLSALVMESVIKIPTTINFFGSNGGGDDDDVSKHIFQRRKHIHRQIILPTTNREKDDSFSSSIPKKITSTTPASISVSSSKSKSSSLLFSTAIAATKLSSSVVDALDNHHHHHSFDRKNHHHYYRFITSLSSKTIGILAVIAASMMSGFGGALSQRTIQCYQVHPLLFSAQLSIFSILYMLISVPLSNSSDWQRIRTNYSNNKKGRNDGDSIFVGWTPYTFIPIVSSAFGGILVGMVTKYSGVVRKGFALIVGLFLSGIFQNILANNTNNNNNNNTALDQHPSRTAGSSSIYRVTKQQWIGGILAAISIWMHSAFPYKP